MQRKGFLIKTNSFAVDNSFNRRPQNPNTTPRSVMSPEVTKRTMSQNSVLDLPTRFQSQDLSVILETAYDQDMTSNETYNLGYKYKCKNPSFVRLEKMQDLVFQKKKQNVGKYNINSKINKSAQPVPKGTVSVMLNNTKKKGNNFNIANQKGVTTRSKFKLKWKTIQWLLKHKKDAISQIFSNYQTLIKFAKHKHNGLNHKEFQELLSYVGLGADANLGEKLFYIFDVDSNGSVDYKELIMGLELFKEDSIEDKMKVFFDLCDVDGSGGISQEEIYEVLKHNIAAYHDRLKLRKTIAKIFIECDTNGDGVLDKSEVLEAAKNNATLRQLLEQSVRNVKNIDQIIDNDLNEQFHEWIPASANFVNYKEGVFYPFNDEILKALGEMEDIYEKQQIRKSYFKDDIDQIDDI